METKIIISEERKKELKQKFMDAFVVAISEPLVWRVIVNTTIKDRDPEDMTATHDPDTGEDKDGFVYLMVDRSTGEHDLFVGGWSITSSDGDSKGEDMQEQEVIAYINELIDYGMIENLYAENY